MTPINATDMQHCSPQHKSYIPSTGVQLRTPSSFAVKSPYAKYPYETQSQQDITVINNKVFNAEKYNCALTNVSINNDIVRSQPIEGRLYDNFPCTNDTVPINKRNINSKIVNSLIPAHLAEQEIVPARDMYTSGNYVPREESASKSTLMHLEDNRETLNNTMPYLVHSEAVNSEAASIAESMLADALLPPSAIRANDIIGSTLDEKELMFIREKLADKYNAAESPIVYAVPKSSRLLDTNMHTIHPHGGGIKENNSFADINKETDNIYKTAITAITKCSAGNLMEKVEVSNVISSLLEAERKTCKTLSHVVQSTVASTDINNEQKQCSRLLNHKVDNESVTKIPHVTMGDVWNPLSDKYKSADPIVSMLNLSSRGEPQYPSPLQAKFDSSILQSTIIHSKQLENQVFPHSIVGRSLDEAAQNMQHIEHLKDTMESIKMDSTKAQKCQKCHEDIRIGDVVVIVEKVNSASWHPGCFVCSVCNELLADLVYFHYKNKLYCGRDLAAFLGIPRCFACDEVSP